MVVSTSMGVQAFVDSGPFIGWLWSSGRVFPPFCPLYCFACRVACKYTFIWRFRGVFGAVWGGCVGLCGFGALRGLWGFCTREWLGGYMTCGVFCLPFVRFLLL